MQKVLTAAQMREVDRLTTERYGIPSIILMENAAHAVARVITEKLGGSVKGKSILILCGPGNNGGDGAALARILWQNNAVVNVILLGKVDQIKGDAKVNVDFLAGIEKDCRTAQGSSYNNIYFFEEDELGHDFSEVLQDHLRGDELAVDALLGTGLTRGMSGNYAECARQLNQGKIDVISLDIPSGLRSDIDATGDPVVSATTTISFTAPKPANVLPPASNRNGHLVVANIGTPVELIDDQPSHLFLSERGDAGIWLEKSNFTSASYKNKRGHALLIAGSENYSGAAVLAGNAAMRSGVGLVTLAAPKECKTEIASRLLPDVILTAIDTDEPELLTQADAIAVGCGLDANDPAIEKLVRKVVSTRDVPVVVDAGALWFFNPPAGIPSTDEGQPSLIFTPHEGEFLRLLGTDDKDAIKDRVAAVREFSQKHNVILVLKGERVLIGEPGGKVVVNPTGNSGLGKAGNGDTLTGILVGFVAQAVKMNIDIFETVVAAVYIAGMAGDIAEKKYGKRVMTASDVRECLTEAFTNLEK